MEFHNTLCSMFYVASRFYVTCCASLPMLIISSGCVPILSSLRGFVREGKRPTVRRRGLHSRVGFPIRGQCIDATGRCIGCTISEGFVREENWSGRAGHAINGFQKIVSKAGGKWMRRSRCPRSIFAFSNQPPATPGVHIARQSIRTGAVFPCRLFQFC